MKKSFFLQCLMAVFPGRVIRGVDSEVGRISPESRLTQGFQTIILQRNKETCSIDCQYVKLRPHSTPKLFSIVENYFQT